MPTSKQNDDFVAELLSDYPLDIAVNWIKANLRPENVFDEAELARWAEENGFVSKDD